MIDPWNVPTGRQLEEQGTTIRTLPKASAKTLEWARRTWTEAKASDFETVGKLYVDKASGVAYRRVPGDPQLGGAGREDVDVWFISHDKTGDGLVYLRGADNPGSVVSVPQGEIGGRQVTGHERGVR